MRQPPTADDMRPAGAPKLLFTGWYLQAWYSWDRARDGRFLMLQGAPPVRLRTLNVMTNLTAARVPVVAIDSCIR